jgi:hypothetical protein
LKNLQSYIFASHGAPPVSLTPLANLPMVSMTLAVNIAADTAGVIDIADKFATGVNASVNDNGGKLPLLSTTLAAN